MDRTNQRLLDLLTLDARESTSSLARKLNLSRTAVHERIQKLERQGVISAYTIQINPDYERQQIAAQVMIKVEPRFNRQVVTALSKVEEIRSLQAVSGNYDFIAMVKAETTEQIDHVLDRIGMTEGIVSTLSSIILSTKFDRASGIS